MELQVKILIVVLIILFTGCTVNKPTPIEQKEENKYSNNFTTEEIRAYWALCQQAFLQKNPYTPRPIIIGHCDCYSDYVRKTYKDREELNNLSIYDNLTKSLITECNFKLQFKFNKPT